MACEAFNDPMKLAVINGANSQKYAAGLNDLQVGPSDETAFCTMQNAIDGTSISESFDFCYNTYDIKNDHWGLGGNGSDYFDK